MKQMQDKDKQIMIQMEDKNKKICDDFVKLALEVKERDHW